jgi:SpoVK/Ycf46/Vps4 family AAA+-type ATPase
VSVFIDEDFRRPVKTHLLANLVAEAPTFPLILGIFGPPGEGKTFQVERICDELGLIQYLVSPGELESENAGAPGQLLRQQYLEAGSGARTGRPGVLILNDVDTILGNWGSLVQYTVNRQVVFAQLMAFCDFPNTVAGQSAVRVPIVLTGNNPSILYGPILRPGRMRLMRWRPNVATRTRMVSPLFPAIDPRELARLISKFVDRPVSFWADVRSSIMESRFDMAFRSMGEAELRRILSNGSRVRIRDEASDFWEVERVANELVAMDLRGENYLSSSEGRGY